MGNSSSLKPKSDQKHTERARVIKAPSEFSVYKSREIPFEWKSAKDVIPDGEFHKDGSTSFQQGELGDCWLMTAIESLRQECNQQFFDQVVRVSDDGLEFRFWQKGEFQRIVKLDNDAVPIREDGSLVFVHNVEGAEYWGILLEKAYAKWLGSYEGLEGGFWVDGIQSFTGGVTERIKLSNVPEQFFDIMLNAYQGGSSLACIKKMCGTQVTEKYHSCCINVVRIEEDTGKIWVRDSNTQEVSEWEYENFIQEFNRLDMCHQNLDKLSLVHNRNIGDGPWESQLPVFTLQWKECDDGFCDEYSIALTDPDDDDEQKCTFILEVVQKIKPDEGEEQMHIKPWDALVLLKLNVGEDTCFCKFPQETYCFTLEPGSHDIKVTVETSEHCEIFMRIFSKKGYQVERKN